MKKKKKKNVGGFTTFVVLGQRGSGNGILVVWTGPWRGLARRLVPGQRRQGVLPPGSSVEPQGLRVFIVLVQSHMRRAL